ncbi:MAG: type IX secretion system membrane protein PorP/SprF [Flavobacteriales bacterium]|nr:type IX secretion system membrane protein PorP/SprF [Flavobacteriales bacterium]
MKKNFVLVLLMFSGLFAFGQQNAQWSQNMFNKLQINPAYAGTNGAICATVLARNQWTSFEGHPKQLVVNADMPIQAIHGGIGLVLLSDQLGPEKTTGLKAAYSFILNAGPGKLSVGVDGGVLMKRLGDGTWAPPTANPDDAIVSSLSAMVPDINAGVYYSQNELYFGVSASQLLANQVYKAAGNSQFDLKRHFYITGGYNYDLNPSIELKPSIYAKSDGTTMQFDFNLNVMYNNQFWAGVTYRPGDAILAMLGMNITSDLRFGYAYDMNITDLSNFNAGTHEIMLGYCKLPQKKKTMKYKNVRYL